MNAAMGQFTVHLCLRLTPYDVVMVLGRGCMALNLLGIVHLQPINE